MAKKKLSLWLVLISVVTVFVSCGRNNSPVEAAKEESWAIVNGSALTEAELQFARRAFENIDHVLYAEAFAAAEAGQHRARGGDADNTGQRLFGVIEQLGADIDQFGALFGFQQAVGRRLA